MNGWVAVRIAVIGASLFNAPSFLNMPGDLTHPAPWYFPFAVGGFSLFGVIFVTGLQRINGWSPARWVSPSWLRSPFSFEEPLQLFDLGAYSLIATGLACLALGLFRTPQNWAWELPLSVGVGVWLGVRFSITDAEE